jgi:hypothetical protein
MSKHKASNAPEGMVVGGQSSFNVGQKLRSGATKLQLGRLKNKRVLAVLAVLLLLIGGYVIYRQVTAPKPVAKSPYGFPVEYQDYGVMTQAQAASQLKIQTGLTIEELKTKKIDGHLLKNFNNAYIAARVLYRFGERDKSLAAYKIAQRKADDSQLNLTFYDNYAAVASASDPELAKSLYNTEKQMVNASTSMSDATKKDTLHNIDTRLALLQSNTEDQ